MQVTLSKQPVQPVKSQSCRCLMIDAVTGGQTTTPLDAGAHTLTAKLSLDAPGLPQLLDLVERFQPSHEVHLVCPGQPARLRLGSTMITLRTLRLDHRIRAPFIVLGQMLGADAALVLGGANVGRGQDGQAFLQTLAELMQVEVSALVRMSPPVRHATPAEFPNSPAAFNH